MGSIALRDPDVLHTLPQFCHSLFKGLLLFLCHHPLPRTGICAACFLQESKWLVTYYYISLLPPTILYYGVSALYLNSFYKSFFPLHQPALCSCPSYFPRCKLATFSSTLFNYLLFTCFFFLTLICPFPLRSLFC